MGGGEGVGSFVFIHECRLYVRFWYKHMFLPCFACSFAEVG